MTEMPIEIQESIKLFRKDFPDPRKVAFLMMKYGETVAHDNIVKGIKDTLDQYGLTAVRADDKEYHPDLYYNILTYLHGCGFGIAVFERIEQNDFNPNVAFEIGYMLACGKHVCLLRDKTYSALQTDLLGKLNRVFDTQQPKESISRVLASWMADKGIIHTTRRSSQVLVTKSNTATWDNSDESKKWNLHQLRFVKRLNRDNVEIELRRSEAGEPHNKLKISFVFGFGIGFPYRPNDNFKKLFADFLESGELEKENSQRWLSGDPYAHFTSLWKIDGNILLNEFPKLAGFDWIAREFEVPAVYDNSLDPDDPSNNLEVYFVLADD
jgi:nucleoside 2-deoxyribosyltransferase